MPGKLKCNIDVVFFKAENVTSCGMCVRNEHGCLQLARTEWFTPLLLVHEGEAYCLLQAIRWIMDLGLVNITFELDCKIVVGAVHSKRKDASEFGAITSQCRSC